MKKKKIIKYRIAVYKISCLITNECYIGSTTNTVSRFSKHKATLIKGEHYSKKLQSSWNEYGVKNFKFEILAICPKEYLVKLEQWFIDTLKPEFNSQKIASNIIEIKFSKEHCKNLSISLDKIKGTSSHHKLKREDVITLIEEFNKYQDIKHLISKFKIQKVQIFRILRGERWSEYNYLVDKDKFQQYKYKVSSESKLAIRDVKSKIHELYAQNMREKDIVKKLNVSKSYVFTVIKKIKQTNEL